MAGIAGIASTNDDQLVEQMLNKMTHRGWAWREVLEGEKTTLGLNGFEIQEPAQSALIATGLAADGSVPGRCAQVQVTSNGFRLQRDPIGAAPLYYGWTKEGVFCVASEVKALLLVTQDVHELPPGCKFDGHTLERYFELKLQSPLADAPDQIARELRRRLENSVDKCIGDGNVGSWLSGGLDSSIMAALARKKVKTLHTFAAGLPGAPDLVYARQMADYIGAIHHEATVNTDEYLAVLPEVIYYLESFDALLVRSSVLNYLVARYASHYVAAVFSGEGGDELFAGYEYLNGISPASLASELIDIIRRLHNTALQRVDRSASAHGTIAHLGFLDPEVVDYALRIPSKYKLYNGVEKWILRESVSDLLPKQILQRKKAKFWEGGGVEELLAEYAESQISSADFRRERKLPNGWLLNTKEELLYYRIFKQQFGELEDLSWMGRTKGAPVN